MPTPATALARAGLDASSGCTAQAAAAVAAAGSSGGPDCGITFGSTGFGPTVSLPELLAPLSDDQDEDWGSDDEPDAGNTKQRTRTFCIGDTVRLWEVMASHQVSARVAQHEQRQSRQQIDAGEHKDTLFADGGIVETMFNDPDVQFTPPHISKEEGLTDEDRALFDPNVVLRPVVKAVALKTHYNKFKSHYSKIKTKWEASGQNEPNFSKFCSGELVYIYFHYRAKESGMTRLARGLPEGLGVEDGFGRAQGSAIKDLGTRQRGKKDEPAKNGAPVQDEGLTKLVDLLQQDMAARHAQAAPGGPAQMQQIYITAKMALEAGDTPYGGPRQTPG